MDFLVGSDREKNKLGLVPSNVTQHSGRILGTSHDLGPQKVAEEGKSPYFREI